MDYATYKLEFANVEKNIQEMIAQFFKSKIKNLNLTLIII